MLQGQYDTPLVLVSILVAMLASYTALTLAERVHHGEPGSAYAWIVGGGLAMGTGIWAMHFIGMLAFRLPIPLGYDLSLTVASWLLPVAVSTAALWQLALPRLGNRQLVLSAILMGAGINAMHYVGMAAMRMQPGIVWDWSLVLLSVAIAVTASGAALWIARHLRHRHAKAWRARLAAAMVMGLAIVGMHYTGMAAAGFPEGSVCLAAGSAFSLSSLAVLVTLGTAAILAIALITAVFDARLEARNEILAATRLASEERRQSLERERAARAEVERLSDLKDQFLATLSHELRTPLHAILGWTQILKLKHDAASLATGLQTIERNARLQASLIDDLLDMSRIVAGKVRLEPAEVDLKQVARAVVEAATPGAQHKGVALALEVDGELPVTWADPARLQQVLANLLSNAVKFTPEGGQVSLTAARQGGEAVFRVTDSGVGIEAGFLPHVFDRFRQADGSTTRRHGGLGLGLSIVRQLVELHGGTVGAESEGPGRGARFTVRLPLLGPPADASAQPAPEGAGEPALAPGGLEGCEVLVVDDEQDSRDLIATLLGQGGARVRTASGAQEAWDMLQGQVPRVLISDIGMPDMDGFDLVRRIRGSGKSELAPLRTIALTAFSRAEDRQRALDAGFDAYLRKPVDTAQLVSLVRSLA